MIEYKLVEFNGDTCSNVSAKSIISWDVSKNDSDRVLTDILEMKLTGIGHREVSYDTELDRWTVILDTIHGDVVVTIDDRLGKMVLLTSKDNTQVLFRVVECILNTGYEQSITYRLQKICACLVLTCRHAIKTIERR